MDLHIWSWFQLVLLKLDVTWTVNEVVQQWFIWLHRFFLGIFPEILVNDRGYLGPWKLSMMSVFCENSYTALKMKFSTKNFFGKYGQILSFLQISSHLLKKSLTENFFNFLAVD